MTTLQSYNGLSVLPESPAPAPGGEAISDNFRELVDWGPKSAWEQTTDPQGSDDVDQDFQPGSFWQNTDDPTTRLFVCRDAGTADQDTAQWDQVIVESVETGAVVIGTDHMNSAPSDPKLAVHAESSDSDTLLVTNAGAQCRTAGLHFKSATHGSSNAFSSGRIVSNFATNGCTTNPGFPGACLTLQSATGDNTFTDVLTVRNGRVGIGTTNPTNVLTAVSNVASGGSAIVASLQANDGTRNQGFFVSCSTAGPAYLTTFHSSGTEPGDLAFGIGNDEVVRITYDAVEEEGYVGIGTTSPSANLHVDGTVKFQNLPTSDPMDAGALWNDSGTLKISAG